MLFAYDTGSAEHPIWMMAEKLGLLERMSFVPFQQDAEPLLLDGDLYIHIVPTTRVQYRTLEASTVDLDLYAADRAVTRWRSWRRRGRAGIEANREHVLDSVRIHTVTAREAGVEIDGTSVIDGVRVVKLKDLVAIKLLSGLKNRGRNKDLGDVEDLIRLGAAG